MPSEFNYTGKVVGGKQEPGREESGAAMLSARDERGASPAMDGLATAGHWGSAEPAGLGNTAGSTLNDGELEKGGLDTLDVALWGYWDEAKHRLLCDELQAAKTCAQDGDNAGRCLVLPSGERAAVRKGGCPYGNAYMQYVLDVGGVEISISEHWEFNENRPQALVSIGSVTLMQIGHVAAWEECKSILAGMGFNVSDSCVSRLDGCTDHPGVDVQEYVHCVTPTVGRKVSRVRKFKTFIDDDRYTGFSGGKTTHLRVYDKVAELREKPDALKQQILEARRWGGPQQVAMRVEFQLRRDSLRENFDVRTVEEVFGALPIIFAWCSEEWFRLTKAPVDRNHTNRAEIWEGWLLVQNGFKAWAGDKRGERKRPVRTTPHYTRLVKQAIGCLSSACAIAGRMPQGAQAFVEVVEELVTPFTRDVADRVREKRALFESLTFGAASLASWSDFDAFNQEADRYNREHEAEHFFDGISRAHEREAGRVALEEGRSLLNRLEWFPV